MMTGNLQSERFCVFQSGAQGFAIPALAVQRVSGRPPLTRIPHSDPILRGISYSQNEFLPVFSLLSLTQVRYGNRTDAEQQMLVVIGQAGNWGMLIDETMGLSDIEVSISTLAAEDDAWSKLVVGSASFQNQVLQVLDPNAIYQYAVRLLDGFWLDPEKVSTELVSTQV